MESEIQNRVLNQENRKTIATNQIAMELRWRMDRLQHELHKLRKTMLYLSVLLLDDPEDVPF